MNINDILIRNGIRLNHRVKKNRVSSYAESYINNVLFKKSDINIENFNIKSGINDIIYNNKVSARGEAKASNNPFQNPIEDLKEVGRDTKKMMKGIWTFIKELFKKFIAWFKKTRYDFKMKRYNKSMKYVLKTVLTAERTKYDFPKWAVDPELVSELKEKIKKFVDAEDRLYYDLASVLKKSTIMAPAGAKALKEKALASKPALEELSKFIDGLPKEMVTYAEDSEDQLKVTKQTCSELFKMLESITSGNNINRGFVMTKLSTDMTKFVEENSGDTLKPEEVKTVGSDLQVALDTIKNFAEEKDKMLATILKGWMKMTKQTKVYDETLNPGPAPTGYVKKWNKRDRVIEKIKEKHKEDRKRRKEYEKNHPKTIVLSPDDIID